MIDFRPDPAAAAPVEDLVRDPMWRRAAAQSAGYT